MPEAKRSKKLGEQQQGYTISSFLFHIESSTPAIENWADENIGNKQSFPVFVGKKMILKNSNKHDMTEINSFMCVFLMTL